MASSMLQLAYGYHLQDDQDPFFNNARQTLENFGTAGMFTSRLELQRIHRFMH